jgi:Protein of unknown function (DUF3306)
MSDLEDAAMKFLQRWSRRKRALDADAPDGAEPGSQQHKDTDAKAPSRAAVPNEAAPPAFDPAALPPVESIDAASDVRAFLAPGVPEELTRAALRRVWASDPAIRDFIGLAENQWDFTKLDAVPGFGSLELTPALRRIIADVIADAPGSASPQPPVSAESNEQIAEIPAKPAKSLTAQTSRPDTAQSRAADDPVASRNATAAPVEVAPQDGDSNVAMHNSAAEAGALRSPQRKHGGAVPK